ncbi:hypothetical protein G7084_00640 [Weissella coleopterorum]|uniref:PucR C-terminal helix-turn-helix domain-containing protein n=1 Tax=Weissella coleopterorum TaxID=2714949 RepID=A0A6G8AXY0_9LACO|nr:hypothetical protein G7084_00640 [Weissella coleopterorum]
MSNINELIQHNGKIKAAADSLHIRRNTLNFRLDALSKSSNQNLLNFKRRILTYMVLWK